MYDTAHEPPARVQRLALKLPGPELAKLNVPVGVVPPVDVSVTVAVHVVDASTQHRAGGAAELVDTGRTNRVGVEVRTVCWSLEYGSEPCGS